MDQLSLLPETPTKPWPEEMVERLNGQMTAIEHRQGRLYCVRDWVYGVRLDQPEPQQPLQRSQAGVDEARGMESNL
jgi:hypothetical protein